MWWREASLWGLEMTSLGLRTIRRGPSSMVDYFVFCIIWRCLGGHGEVVWMGARVVGWGWLTQGFTGGLTLKSLNFTSG